MSEIEEPVPVTPESTPAPQGMTGIAALNAVTGFALRVSGMVVGIALTPFVLHRIGRELYGISATAGSVLDYLWLLRGGLGTGMRRYVTVNWHSGNRELANRYYAAGFWWSAVLRIAVVGAGVALSRWVCGFMSIPANLMTDAVGGLMLIFLAAGINDVGGIFEIPTYTTGHTSSISIVRIAGMVLRVALIVPAFFIFTPSLRVYALAALVCEVIVMLALQFLAARQGVVDSIMPKPDFGTAEVRNALFRFSGLQVISQVAAILYLSTDNLLIGRFYGAARVTEYSLGTRWAPMITGVLWAGGAALMPLFTRMDASGDVERTRRALLRSAAVMTAVGVPLFLVPCVIGDVFLARWVGEEYRHCSSYMIAMLVPMFLGVPLEPLWVALQARGRIGWIAAGDVFAAVLNPFLSLLLALKFGWGLLGFALGNTIAILLKNMLLRPLMNRGETAMPSLWRTMAVLPPAILGGAPGLALLWFAKPFYSGSLAAVIAAGAVGALLSFAGATLATVGWADTHRIATSLLARVRGR